MVKLPLTARRSCTEIKMAAQAGDYLAGEDLDDLFELLDGGFLLSYDYEHIEAISPQDTNVISPGILPQKKRYNNKRINNIQNYYILLTVSIIKLMVLVRMLRLVPELKLG